MSRTLIVLSALTIPVLFGTGCSTYSEAELACQEDFDLENDCRAEVGQQTYSITKERQCATAVGGISDEAAIAAKVTQYDCSIAVWNAADCTTDEGFLAASEASVDCFF